MLQMPARKYIHPARATFPERATSIARERAQLQEWSTWFAGRLHKLYPEAGESLVILCRVIRRDTRELPHWMVGFFTEGMHPSVLHWDNEKHRAECRCRAIGGQQEKTEVPYTSKQTGHILRVKVKRDGPDIRIIGYFVSGRRHTIMYPLRNFLTNREHTRNLDKLEVPRLRA